MTPLNLWNPGDEILLLAANILMQVTLVTVATLLMGIVIRRNPAVRYGVLWAALLLVLSTPAVAVLMQNSGHGLLTVQLMTDHQAPDEAFPPQATVGESTPSPQSSVGFQSELPANIPEYSTGTGSPTDASLSHDARLNAESMSLPPLETSAIARIPVSGQQALCKRRHSWASCCVRLFRHCWRFGLSASPFCRSGLQLPGHGLWRCFVQQSPSSVLDDSERWIRCAENSGSIERRRCFDRLGSPVRFRPGCSAPALCCRNTSSSA